MNLGTSRLTVEKRAAVCGGGAGGGGCDDDGDVVGGGRTGKGRGSLQVHLQGLPHYKYARFGDQDS